MTLATITTSLSSFLGLATESDLDFIDVRGGGDDEEENREDKMLPSDTATEEVEESWDAEDDDEKKEPPAWEEGEGLLNVLKAFKALKEDFDTKFRAMWA